MSILTIGPIRFAQKEFSALSYQVLSLTGDASNRQKFIQACQSGEYDQVVAIHRYLHDTILGKFDRELIQALPKSVKVIANVGAGYDQIEVQAASDKGIYVTNTPDAVRESTADTALFLLLGVLRNFGEGIASLNRGEWIQGLEPGRCPSSRKIGILGMGSIGKAFAERCLPLGAELQYHNRKPHPDAPPSCQYVSMDKLLSTSHVLLVSIPLNATTRHILSVKEFAKMQKGSYLINTARGPIIDEDAMVKALDDGILKGVGLDVFENEPKVHPGLLGRPGCVLLPHMGTHTTDATKLMETQSIANIQSILCGGRLNIVPEQKAMIF